MTARASAVSRETAEALAEYWRLLLRWNDAVNLVGRSTEGDGWRRHIEDSTQLADHFPDRAVLHCDLGSGGGLPAIPVTVHRRLAGFEDRLIMIEADSRKAAFLRTASRTLGLGAEIVVARGEEAPPAGADVVTARALAPLNRLLDYVDRHLDRDGCAILPKGRAAREEVAAARQRWSFDLQLHSSRTATDAAILHISDLRSRAT